MYCNKCGTKNADDAGFCSKCGASLQGEPSFSKSESPSGVGTTQKQEVKLSATQKKVVFSWLGMLVAFFIPYADVSINQVSGGGGFSLYPILFAGELTQSFVLWFFVLAGLGALVLCIKAQYQMAYIAQMVSSICALLGYWVYKMTGGWWSGLGIFTLFEDLRLGYFLVLAISIFQFFVIRKEKVKNQ